MKQDRIKCIAAAVLCALVLCACAAGGTQTDPTRTTGAPEGTLPPETEPVQTEPGQTAPLSAVPYTTALGAQTGIFAGPSYDESFVCSVGKDGVYTIVEEAWDEEGNLWGRLKSGLGWVDLTNAGQTGPISAYLAGDEGISGEYHRCIVEDSEYTVKIVLRAHETLTNVAFCALDYAGDSYETAQTLYTLDTLTGEKPLVMGVVFYGDLTAYGISFTDASGHTHHYALYISGRNGALELTEYTPA